MCNILHFFKLCVFVESDLSDFYQYWVERFCELLLVGYMLNLAFDLLCLA